MEESHTEIAAYNKWASSRSQMLPKNAWRLRAAILLSMVVGFGIELISRHLRSTSPDTIPTAKLFSLVGLTLLCASAMYLIFLLDQRYVLKSMVSLATLSLLLSQVLSILREYPAWTNSHSHIAAWSLDVEGVVLLSGVMLLLTTFYLALLDTVTVKALLRKQHIELYEQFIERERAQADLKESRDQIRQLSAHVERAREEERARMARELHDELGQNLTSLKIDLGNLKRHFPEGPDSNGKCQEIISSMKTLLDATVQTTRRLITELHPAILDDLGLQAATEWLIFDFAKRTGIRCTLNATLGDTVFESNRATALFRVMQECLTNIVRHANATEVNVKMRVDDGAIVLEVQDNGCGINHVRPKDGRRKFGILGMKERMASLDGYVDISSTFGKGTRVTASIPHHLDRKAFDKKGEIPDEYAGI